MADGGLSRRLFRQSLVNLPQKGVAIEKKLRLFIAVNLPGDVKTVLSSVSNYFQHPAVRWTSAQNLHLTVHFIGMVQQDAVAGIVRHLSAITESTTPFSLTFAELTTIGRRRKPAMVWAQFEHSAAFETLAVELQRALPGDNSKAPLPHVTLARIKEGGLRELPALPFIKKFSMEVQHIELMESQTGGGAPVYTTVEKFKFKP